MMEDISSHIMDIVTNSVRAKAKHVSISVMENTKAGLLNLTVKDDGTGMDLDTARKIQDPFFSTKKGRKVGLGVPLLKGTAETTGGLFSLQSEPGKGTEIFASLNLNHPDLPVVGNLKDTILVLVVGNPEVDFTFTCGKDEKVFVLDTEEIKRTLEDVPVNHPEVIKFLTKYLDENM
jgi:signal transduction histidine kinase